MLKSSDACGRASGIDSVAGLGGEIGVGVLDGTSAGDGGAIVPSIMSEIARLASASGIDVRLARVTIIVTVMTWPPGRRFASTACTVPEFRNMAKTTLQKMSVLSNFIDTGHPLGLMERVAAKRPTAHRNVPMFNAIVIPHLIALIWLFVVHHAVLHIGHHTTCDGRRWQSKRHGRPGARTQS